MKPTLTEIIEKFIRLGYEQSRDNVLLTIFTNSCFDVIDGEIVETVPTNTVAATFSCLPKYIRKLKKKIREEKQQHEILREWDQDYLTILQMEYRTKKEDVKNYKILARSPLGKFKLSSGIFNTKAPYGILFNDYPDASLEVCNAALSVGTLFLGYGQWHVKPHIERWIKYRNAHTSQGKKD